MGAISATFWYQLGKRREKRRKVPVVIDQRDISCIHYDSFCSGYGSCEGMTCEYPK